MSFDGGSLRFTVGMAYSPPEHYVPIAKAADEAGYHAIACSDHVVNLEELKTPYPYTKDGSRRWKPFTPWLDPWVTIGAMAAATERLRFFTNVYVLPLRNPFTVAKAVGTAAALSGGRVALGVGMGWCEEEFELMEQPFAGRGKRADEEIEVLRKLWSGEWVEHHGDSYDFPRLEMSPGLAQPVPIYVGGHSDAAVRRAARVGDGWIGAQCSQEDIEGHIGRLRAALDAEGRAGQPFEIKATPLVPATVDDMAKLAAAGLTDVMTVPWYFVPGDPNDPQHQLESVAWFAEHVIHPLRDLEVAP